ncbi:hypothetical protein IFT76_06625 [Pseudomonas sp. CFBP 13727]|nr:hypothetical protein [Pseudomonas sp. CFBP 13727]
MARHPIEVAAANPIIGYRQAVQIAELAYREGRPMIDVALEHMDLRREQLGDVLDPEKLTAGGI